MTAPRAAAKPPIVRLLAWLALLACSDPAQQEYFAALEAADRGAPIEEQLAHAERAIALEPGRAEYWEMRAGYRAGLGELAGAEADYDRAVALRDRPYLRFSRGSVIARRGEPARALSDLDLAIQRQPENTQFYRARALARVEAGRAEEGLADAEHAVARLPQQGQSWYVRGVARLALGRAAEARADFDQALRLLPELAYVYRKRAEACERLGDLQGAAADRARAAAAEEARSGCGMCREPYS